MCVSENTSHARGANCTGKDGRDTLYSGGSAAHLLKGEASVIAFDNEEVTVIVLSNSLLS